MRLKKDPFGRLVNEQGRENGIISISEGKFEAWKKEDIWEAWVKLYVKELMFKRKNVKLETKGSKRTLSYDF